jgi:hypothetical protein
VKYRIIPGVYLSRALNVATSSVIILGHSV